MSCSYPLINLRSEHKKKYPSMKKNFLSSKKKYPSMKKKLSLIEKKYLPPKKISPTLRDYKKNCFPPASRLQNLRLPPQNPPKTPDFPENPRKPPKTPKIVENGGFPGGPRGGPKPPKTPKIRVFGGSPRGAENAPPGHKSRKKCHFLTSRLFGQANPATTRISFCPDWESY